jgi:hypothetical protein
MMRLTHTARQESVRLFHIVVVEEGYFLGQYDVPQVFLLADIDNDIFVFPLKVKANSRVKFSSFGKHFMEGSKALTYGLA